MKVSLFLFLLNTYLIKTNKLTLLYFIAENHFQKNLRHMIKTTIAETLKC